MNNELENFDLEKHHEVCFQALCEVDELFKKHQIPYFLLAGTTLGAVRHGGFIPWDDDIDIGIFRQDVKKAGKILQKEISDRFTYEDCYTSKTFPRLFGKLMDNSNGYGCVDFFPLIKTSDHMAGRRVQWSLRKILFKLYKAKIGYANEREITGFAARLKTDGAKVIAAPFSRNVILKLVHRNETRYENLKDNKYYVVLYGSHSMENESVLAEWLKEPSEITFNGRKFPTMGDVDAYLTNMYGDYMTPPKKEEQGLRHGETFLE